MPKICFRTASKLAVYILPLTFLALLPACGGGSSKQQPPLNPLLVNSLEDTAAPAAGTVTLRSAIARAGSGEAITFASSLNGGTITLTTVGGAHSILKGEIYSGMTYQGYGDRDYGKSALYVAKNLVIDASSLPSGITIKWGGDDTNRARVLAVLGDLTLKNVTITGGYASAEAITGGTQPYTLARGGGLAVWGTATLDKCAIVNNRISGDLESSRDRGALGGGIYANAVVISNSVISGNSAIGSGAAGGGIYSVGGSDLVNATNAGINTSISQSTISGNRVTAQNAYAGGVFTLGGGPTNFATMTVTNSTIARNIVEDHPDIPNVTQFYYRGGGIFLGGGSLTVASSTVAENEVTGQLAMFSGKPNIGGGGIMATVGSAHVVEDLTLQHSIVAGNKLNGADNDVSSGTVINFYSNGYNLIGALDFSQILVPASQWLDLNRKHYPKVGDHDGVLLSDVVDLARVSQSGSVISAGTDSGQHAVLSYPPKGGAVNQIPKGNYSVTTYAVGYTGYALPTDDFLNKVLEKIRTNYSSTLGSDFGSSYGDMTGVTFWGPAKTWPTNAQNAPWISFWRTLDTNIGNQLGTVKLGEDFWKTFTTGPLGNEVVTVTPVDHPVQPVSVDQLGHARSNSNLDIGAIEE